MPRFTDEQVEAARMALPAFSFPTPSQMRAALEAAADTAPAVDTTEFEREIEAYRKALYRYENYWRYAGEEGGDPEELACKVVDSRQRLIDMFREAAR